METYSIIYQAKVVFRGNEQAVKNYLATNPEAYNYGYTVVDKIVVACSDVWEVYYAD